MILLIKTDKYFKQLNIHISTLLKNDIYKNRHIEACPTCGEKRYIKYGSYNGIQRYKCKECGSTFSNATNCLWSYSKKEPTKWIQFIEYILERKSLRFCAEKLEISLVTAFYWRHKVLHGLTFSSVPEKLSGNVYIQRKLLPENFKGSKNITTNKRHNIWVIAAKGDYDSLIAKPISRGFWDLPSFNKKIYYLIDKKSYIIPYGDRYISLVANKHNKKRIKIVQDDNKLKFFHNTLGLWLKKYHGVATKYLEEYLSLFSLFIIEKQINSMGMFNQLSSGDKFIKIKVIGSLNDAL